LESGGVRVVGMNSQNVASTREEVNSSWNQTHVRCSRVIRNENHLIPWNRGAFLIKATLMPEQNMDLLLRIRFQFKSPTGEESGSGIKAWSGSQFNGMSISLIINQLYACGRGEVLQNSKAARNVRQSVYSM